MEDTNQLLQELQLLQDLEYSEQFSKRYHFEVDSSGMVHDHSQYPELKEVFPELVPVLELNEFMNRFTPSLVLYFDYSDTKLPGTTVIDWSKDMDEL